MALFKIFKGNSSGLPTAYNDGYAYFTYDDGKFYIDYLNKSDGEVYRKPLNAEYSDKIVDAPVFSWVTDSTSKKIALAMQWAGHDTTQDPAPLPFATLDYAGALSAGDQSIGGIKTFYASPVFRVGVTLANGQAIKDASGNTIMGLAASTDTSTSPLYLYTSGSDNLYHNGQPILTKTNYATYIDDRYVNISGDTMSGNLNLVKSSTSDQDAYFSVVNNTHGIQLRANASGRGLWDTKAGKFVLYQGSNTEGNTFPIYIAVPLKATSTLNVTGDATFAANISALSGNIGSGGLSVGGSTSAQNINPSETSVYSLGTSTLKWKHVYADQMTATTFNGNATSADKFSANKTVSLSGHVKGSATSNGSTNWAISTTIQPGVVTNAMLAGSIANDKLEGGITNDKLANSSITIANNTVALGESITLADLGLSNAMHFVGVATVTVAQGSTTDPEISGYNFTSERLPGDVIMSGEHEFVWTIGGTWERLGGNGSYKVTQSAVVDPTASGNSSTYIKTISQNAQGVITATKATIANLKTQVNGTDLWTYNAAAARTINFVNGGDIAITASGNNVTIGHANAAVTAKTAYASTATTAAADGGTIKVTDIKYDAYGHITGSTDRTITLSQIKTFTITANASDDNVVNLTGTSGTNAVTYSVSHKAAGPSTQYSSGNTTTAATTSSTIKIPQLTVDTYGHTNAAADESITFTTPKSGDWWNNGFVTVNTTGYTEIGRYLDFHTSKDSTEDFDIRIDAGTTVAGRTLYLPDLSGQFVVHTNDTAIGSDTQPVYVAASGQVTASAGNVGASNKPMYMSGGVLTASNSTIGSNVKPMYISSGTLTASTGTVGSGVKPMYMSSGTLTASSSTVGSGIKPIYLNSGTLTASSSTIGSSIIPMYMSSGTLTASSETVGSGTVPMYMDEGTLTASTSTVGSGTVPMYMSNGTLTASTSTVGSGVKPIFLSSGTLTASSSTVGSAALPVFLSSGTITSCTASSIFSNFSSTAGANGETLSITIAGQPRTVTLDAASTSQGGVVTTGSQSFAGAKTFTSGVTLANSTTSPYIYFKPTTANNTFGHIYLYTPVSSSAITGNRFYFRQYSYESGSSTRLSYYENYMLPQVTAGRTSNGSYTILTTKNVVTVGQGGTGKSSWTKFRLIYAAETSADSTTSTTLSQIAAGTAGYVLQSNGSTAAPSWLAQSSIAAGTAAQFASGTTVAVTGDATGTSASSTKGWSVPLTLAASGVTAGSYGPSANATLTSAGTFSVPYFTVDSKGRVTAASTKTMTMPTIGNATITIAAGNGLTTGGSFTTNATSAKTITLNVGAGAGLTVSADAIGHSNNITAGTATGGSGTLTHGGTFTVPTITYDANGHITTTGTTTYTLPTDNNTDTKVTQAAAITTAGEYPVILGYSTATTAVTNTVNKTSTLTYNPSTKILTATTFKGALSGTADVATKLGTATLGSATKPIYLSSGTATACSTYAGGTAVTLNGSSKAASTASFYAPTSAGTAGYLLSSSGSGAPTWLSLVPVESGGTGRSSFATPTVTWTAGTTAGPTLTVKDSLGQSTVTPQAIPSASGSASGIVTTGAQTFAGAKTFTGDLTVNNGNSSGWIKLMEDGEGGTIKLTGPNATYTWEMDAYNNTSFRIFTNGSGSYKFFTFDGSSGAFTAPSVYGAVWNDYAEFRATKEEIEAGRVVVENGDDTLSLATERLMPGANVVSDTFGFAIGETETSKTPLAVSGRALVYTYEDRNSYNPGDPVCSGPNGTVSKMTREEIMTYPDRMIGTVSAIPDYETWGTGDVKVNGRIWIKVH